MARILVSMPDAFLKSIDDLASTEQRSRSELVREALRAYVKRKPQESKRSVSAAQRLEELLD